jgi:hypothetical protein
MAYNFSKIETPSYKVIKIYDGFELRQYESMVVAQTVLKEKSSVRTSEEGLKTVSGYIDGQNSQNRKIAMTSPVIMEMGDNARMALVLPKEHALESLPEPNSDKVEIVNVLPKKYAVLTFPGYTDDKKIERYSEKLLKAVRKEGLRPVGNVHFMGYSDPWQVIGRKNEVAIEIK